MIKKLIKNIIGFLFIPVVFSITRVFYLHLINIDTLTSVSRYFLLGFVAYVISYIVFIKLDYLYVLGHESVHALFVWFFGGRVLSFKVKSKSGSITATKSNIFIDLAPYFVPIYTIAISLIYLIGSSFWHMGSILGYFIFFIGFSFSFHLIMTVDKMKIEQPDFLKFGYLNSLILIYLINISIMSVFFGFLFPDFSCGDFFDTFFRNTKELYIDIFDQLF